MKGGHTRLAGLEKASLVEKGDNEAALAALGLGELRGQLPIVFDVLEVCSGRHAPFTSACVDKGLVVGPAIDILRFGFWDLLREEVFVWLCQVVSARRVFYLHCGPPCTTFSQARRPPLRSVARPFGDSRSPQTVMGARLLLRCLFLLGLQDKAELPGSLEHPRGALTRHLPQMQSASQSWLSEGVLSMCSFGAPWRKDTSVFTVRAQFLEPLMRPCSGGHASGWEAALRRRPRPATPDAKALGSPWVNSLLRGLDFQERKRCHWRRRRHINLQELSTLRWSIDYVPERFGPNRKVIFGVGLLVTCGVANKGRSASRALNLEWRRLIRPLLCGQLRVATHCVPSRHNPADAPSRGRPLLSPTARLPVWWQLRSEDLEAFDRWASCRCRKGVSAWAELMLRLQDARRGGRREAPARGEAGRRRKKQRGSQQHFDGSGLEGAGPPRSQPRPNVRLASHRGLTHTTSKRRALFLSRLQQWLPATLGTSLASLLAAEVGAADAVLAEFGQFMYDSGKSLHDFSESLYAVVDLRRDWRRRTAVAWDVAKAWRMLMPFRSHRPVPLAVLMAMIGATRTSR